MAVRRYAISNKYEERLLRTYIVLRPTPKLFTLAYMSDGGFKIRDQQAVHFITFAVVGWIDAFTRQQYRDIFLDKIRQSQRENGLSVHGWVLMSNHFHGIVSAKENSSLSHIIGEVKRKSSMEIAMAIEKNDIESRREWILELLERAGNDNPRNGKKQFWQQDNHPKECHSRGFAEQKLNYIHQNPVRAGIVDSAEQYLYSSARDYAGQKGLLDIAFLW